MVMSIFFPGRLYPGQPPPWTIAPDQVWLDRVKGVIRGGLSVVCVCGGGEDNCQGGSCPGAGGSFPKRTIVREG